jgi:hypothetical protein
VGSALLPAGLLYTPLQGSVCRLGEAALTAATARVTNKVVYAHRVPNNPPEKAWAAWAGSIDF